MREIFWGKVYKFYGVLAMTECLVIQPVALEPTYYTYRLGTYMLVK